MLQSDCVKLSAQQSQSQSRSEECWLGPTDCLYDGARNLNEVVWTPAPCERRCAAASDACGGVQGGAFRAAVSEHHHVDACCDNCSVNTNCATEGRGRAFLVAQPDSSGLTAARVHAGRCVAVHTFVLLGYRSSLDAFVGFNLAAPLPLNTVCRASANPSYAGTACRPADTRYSDGLVPLWAMCFLQLLRFVPCTSRSTTIPLAVTTLFVASFGLQDMNMYLDDVECTTTPVDERFDHRASVSSELLVPLQCPRQPVQRMSIL